MTHATYPHEVCFSSARGAQEADLYDTLKKKFADQHFELSIVKGGQRTGLCCVGIATTKPLRKRASNFALALAAAQSQPMELLSLQLQEFVKDTPCSDIRMPKPPCTPPPKRLKMTSQLDTPKKTHETAEDDIASGSGNGKHPAWRKKDPDEHADVYSQNTHEFPARSSCARHGAPSSRCRCDTATIFGSSKWLETHQASWIANHLRYFDLLLVAVPQQNPSKSTGTGRYENLA